MFAENSAGTRSFINCEMSTYDSTPPTGRLHAEFTYTSNPNIIQATILVHDDSDIFETFVAIGFGTGQYGDQLLSWEHMQLKENSNKQRGKLLESHWYYSDGVFVLIIHYTAFDNEILAF